MHQVISLTGTPPSPLLLFLFVYFLAQFDVKQAEVSLASASDKADIILGRQGSEMVLNQGGGKCRWAL